MISLPPQPIANATLGAPQADEPWVLRPENRRRHPEAALWSDTLPDWFRSEGFAEDLSHLSTASSPASALPAVLAGRRATQAGPVPALAAVLAVTRMMWARRMA